MYLGDADILRAFGEGHATLRPYLLRVPWSEIALKATPVEALLAHQRLLDTQ